MIQDVRSLESKRIVPVYRRNPVVLVRGKGVYLYDSDGREYIDLISGIGVCALGHSHEGLAAALALQARELMHCSNLFYHELQGQLADRLAALSGLSRAFFCNSGTEAVEACLKFARRYWHTRGQVGRTGIVALEGSFHGRTYGALSVTAGEHYRVPFAPLLPGIAFTSATNPAQLSDAVSSSTAAIIVEAIQGEGGVRPLTPEFAGALVEVCQRTGALLIADEVQCGMGRTGYPFYFSALGLKPHLVAVGKALGAGVPIGAALVHEDVAQALSPGDHGSTFGGNLLACRAALVFLDHLEQGGVLAHVQRMGAYLDGRLRTLAGKHPGIAEVRGSGLMWGLELKMDATPVVEGAMRRGVFVNRTATTVVRLLPPLTITEAELDRAITVLDEVFAETLGGVS
jgi:acetylornithine/N-succinyldiaminopimelate aminotransferase